MQNFRDWLESIVAKHPGCRMLEIDEETQKRAQEDWEENMRKLAPKFEELRQERIQALSRARNMIIGSSLS